MAQRIHSIDGIRAVALLGIAILHCAHGYNAPVPPPGSAWDEASRFFVENFITGRALPIFSYLFGLSFFLQMDHAAVKGIDFRGRFCWRLILLFLFGMLDACFFNTDILTLFCASGFMLVLLWNVRSAYLLIAACLFLIQPFLLYGAAIHNPGCVASGCRWVCWQVGLEPCSTLPNYGEISFAETVTYNLKYGIIGSWVYRFWSGRMLTLLGMFLLGMLSGRSRIFEYGGSRLLRLWVAWLGIFAVVSLIKPIVPPSFSLYFTEMKNLCYVLSFIPFLGWLFSLPRVASHMTMFRAIGRCTLTGYISQNVLLTCLFYHWGLGLAKDLTDFPRLLIGIGFFVLQMLFFNFWLRHFQYGPLEGIWRKLTRIGLKD